MDSKPTMQYTRERLFDDPEFDRFSLYDNMPYQWDTDSNIDKIFRKETGNLIKGYRCKMDEPVELKFSE
ncbi:MAG TPA: hypothetical protein GXX75_25680 [Clostridiales bacterium]|nr:hypothetical protein [Clostridiales bacterium]